jgi:hypothetical protein
MFFLRDALTPFLAFIRSLIEQNMPGNGAKSKSHLMEVGRYTTRFGQCATFLLRYFQKMVI